MSDEEKNEEAVAQVIVAAMREAKRLYPTIQEGAALELMARVLLLRGAAVLREGGARG